MKNKKIKCDIYQSIHNHADRCLQSGCLERKPQEICGPLEAFLQ